MVSKIIVALIFSLSFLAFPAVSIVSSHTFDPADPARTWMDAGGAWDGNADVSATTGDTFTLSIQNEASSTDPLYDLAARFVFKPALAELSGSATLTGAGCGASPTVSFSRVVNDVTVNFTPTGYDLPIDCQIDISIGAVSNGNITIGDLKLSSFYQYAAVDSGPLGSETKRVASFETRLGEILVGQTTFDLEQAVGEDVQIDIEGCNLGSGGLFDVVIDESNVDPNTAGSLQIQTLTQTTPVAPVSIQVGQQRTLPYLAPGECFTVRTISRVTNCSEIDHISLVSHRNRAAQEVFSSVTLDLTTPVVSFGSIPSSFISPIVVPGTGTSSYSLPIYNIGGGVARNLTISLPIPADVIVTNIGTDWSRVGDVFTYTAGDITGLNTLVTLTFDVERAPVCPITDGRTDTIIGSASYLDACGNAFALPTNITQVIIADASEPFTLDKTSSSSTFSPGGGGSYNLVITRGEAANLSSDPLIISDVLPAAGVDSYSVGAAPAGTSFLCGGDTTCDPGETLTWTITKAQLTANASLILPVSFVVTTDECSAGTSVVNSVTSNYTMTAANCAASQIDSARFHINTATSGGGLGLSTLTLSAADGGGSYETGLADGGDAVRQELLGEGEFLSFNRTLDFTAGGIGNWTGSTHTDDFGGLASQTIVPTSVQVKLNNGAAIAVPGGSIISSTGSLVIDLTFLAGGGFFGVDSVVGQKLEIEYKATINDSDLGGNISLGVTSLSSTSISGGGGAGAGCSTGVGTPMLYSDFQLYSIARRALATSISIPQTVEICGVTPITIISNKPSTAVEFGWHPIITMINGGYEFNPVSLISYGGDYNVGNMTSTLAASNSTFEYGPEALKQTQASTIGFDVTLPATSSIVPADFCSAISYDDTQEVPGIGKGITNANTCSKPVQVVAGDLVIVVTPDNLQVDKFETEFTIKVVNSGAGTAYNVDLSDTIPAGFTPDKAQTDILNAASPDNNVTVVGNLMTWSLGDIAPGAQVSMKVAIIADASTCAPINNANNIVANWGCGGTDHQTVSSVLPNFKFIPASIDIVHDASFSTVAICDDGAVSKGSITVKNTSNTTIFNLLVEEVLNSLTTGISMATVPAYEYSIDQGSSWLPMTAPSGTGTTGDPYIFDAGVILDPSGGFGPLKVFKIRFNLAANELASSSPDILATAGGNISCGDAATATAASFSIDVVEPEITMSKRGKNNTSGSSFSETSYGRSGDVIQWELNVTNSSSTTALHIELTDDFTNNGSVLRLLNGPGHVNTAVTDNVALTINDAPTGTLAYLIDETLGSTCLDGSNTASVTWACSAASTNRLSAPSDNSDTAQINMNGDPAITQSWVSGFNGKGDIVIDFINNGAYIENFSLDVGILAGYLVDTTDIETATKDAGAIVVSRAGTSSNPTYTFPGTFLRNGETLQIIIPVVPSTFDTLFDDVINPETVANTFDVALPTSGNNSVSFNYDNSCSDSSIATDNTVLDPISADLDISVSPTSKIASDTEVVTFTYTITNNGDAGSIASEFIFDTTIGVGWSTISTLVLTPGVGGAGGACAANSCSSAQLGSLAQGASAVVTVQATVTTGGSLQMEGEVTGSVINNAVTTLGNYSFDRAKSKVIGVTQTLVLKSTSETHTTGSNLAIGEDAVYTSTLAIFGVEAGDSITGLTLRNTIPVGMGYTSHTTTGNHDMAIPTENSTQWGDGALDFVIPGIVSVDSTFEVDLTLRVLNDDSVNTDGKSLTQNQGSSFTYQGDTFASNDGIDGFAGSESNLHNDLPTTIVRPVMTIVKEVRNISSGAFAATAQGDAGDTMEYRVVITNSGSAAAFDLTLPDVLNAKLNVINGTADAVDNDGDGTTDSGDSEGTYGLHTVTFNEANTLLVAGDSMAQLDGAKSITFLYRATLDATVTPADTLLNDADINWTTLPGAAGSQSVPVGVADTPEGEAVQTLNAQATVEAVDVTFDKELIATSLTPVVDEAAVIGEQLRFRLDIELPSGSVPGFKVRDSIPSGFSLVEISTPTLGLAVSCGAPSSIPAVLPANGAPLAMEIDFGNCTVTLGATAIDRTVRVEYVVQVRNITANVDTLVLTNTADYIFTGFDGPDSSVNITIKEPQFSAVKTVDNTETPTDAGATIRYKVLITNTGTATAYDVDIIDSIPIGATFKAASTVDIAGASAGTPVILLQDVKWGKSAAVSIDIAPAGTFEFTYEVTLDDSVEPDEVLTNAIDVSTASLPLTGPELAVGTLGTLGDADGARGGLTGDALNDYFYEDGESITVANTYSSTKTKITTDTVAAGGFRVGDEIEFKIDITLQEGTTDNVKFEDTLPAGLEFESFTAISPVSDGTTWNYTLASNPSNGDTGAISWSLGTVVSGGDNSAANQTLSINYKVKVVDASGIANAPTTQNIMNTFRLTYEDKAANAETTPNTQVAIDLKQPSLAITKTLKPAQPTTIGAGDFVDYIVTLTNNGDAPAYNATIKDILPIGLRQTVPTSEAATTLNGAVTAIANPAYTPATGVAVWTLTDAQSINPGQTLVLHYRAMADSDVGAGLSLVNSANIEDYFSLPALPVNPDRRSYGSGAPVSAAVVNIVAPTDMGKSVGAATSQVGDTIVYTLTVPQTSINAKIYDVKLTDVIPANLEIISVTNNSVALSATLTDTTVGNNLALEFDELDPSEQATITITTRLLNSAVNQDAVVVANSGAFTWASINNDTAKPAITSPTANVTIEEPALVVTKTKTGETKANASLGFQAGDKVVFTISITNSGTGVAHQVSLDDSASEDLVTPVVTANPDNPGAPVEGATALGKTAWTWSVASIAAGATYTFDVEYTLSPTVTIFQILSNEVTTSWKSNAVDNPETRDGSDPGNDDDYINGPSSAQITVGGLQFDKVLASVSSSPVAVGEHIFFDLKAEDIVGQIDKFRIQDILPTGSAMSYVGHTITVNNVQKQGGGAVVAIAPLPTVGDTGTISIDFGDIERIGPNASIIVRIEARVEDIIANASGSNISNNAQVLVDDPNNPGTDIPLVDASPVVLQIQDPAVLVGLDGPADLDLGEVASLSVRMDNTSLKPAFQPAVQVSMPVGMRDTDPTTLTEVATISGGRNIVLVKGVDYTTTYVAATGLYEVVLISAQAFLDVGETITVNFEAKLDDDLAGGASLDIDTAITNFYTVDNSTTPTVNRSLGGALGVGTTGTANAALGDDDRDNNVITSRAPILTIVKSVDNATIGTGQTLTYTMVITNSGTADATVTTLTDDLSQFFKLNTLAVASIVPACSIPCTLNVVGAGGVNSTGTFNINDFTVAGGGGTRTIVFTADVVDVVPSGSIIENQASADVDGFSNLTISDSGFAADDNATEEGNNGADPNDDDPTRTVILSEPELELKKSSDHASKTGAIAPGDVLTYTIIIDNNNGTENTNNSQLIDAIPAFTTYVANSTTLNATPVADIGGTSALISGLDVNTVGSAAGVLTVGAIATVTFQVKVNLDVTSTAVISNQAQLNAIGDGSGPLPALFSDDPDTGTVGDPTRDYLNTNPQMTVEKSVLDLNGGTLVIGETVEYQITLRNDGLTAITDGNLVDNISSHLTYTAATLSVDEDGPAGAGGFTALTDASGDDNGEVVGAALIISSITVAAQSAYTIKFRGVVNVGVVGGTLISNQATFSADGIGDVLTDSDGNPDNGEQPTSIIVGAAPSIRVLKQVTDINGGTLNTNDELGYLITVQNIGSVDATNVVITDAVAPASTTYVAASTLANSVLLADAVGVSPLVTGHNLGTITAGGSATISFKVSVDTGIAAATTITNQATYTADGGLSGFSDSDVNDGIESGNDGADPNDDDPTLISVGGASGGAILQGSVWLDENHNGLNDSGEEQLSGWVVEILKDGVLVDTVKTDSNGNYIFKGLPPGSGYQVLFRHPENGVVYGGAKSSAPGIDTSDGTIRNLILYEGLNLLDQNQPVDPSGVIYDAITRNPISGIPVALVGPAGFDPTIHLLPGQLGQVTATDGRYRFDLTPAAPIGTYRLVVTNPGSYLPGASQILPPTTGPFDATGFPDPYSIGDTNFAPTGTQAIVYYYEFSIDPTNPLYPNIINNHIPIDPILDGAITITKTTPLVNVSKGDIVPYTIIARNNIAANIGNIDVTDQLPPGFAYMDGSATIDGVKATPVKSGRTLNFANLNFLNGANKTIKLLLRVGLGVREGEYVNSAYALNNVVGAQVSNTGQATVRVVPDAIFDCPEIIGRVFDDTNKNGYLDKGEVGIPGVQLATARGWLIKTDEYGRYHVACPAIVSEDIGSNFILKVDPRTLPTGYRMISHNPKLMRLTRGKASKVNFGASIDRVLHIEVHGETDFGKLREIANKLGDERFTIRTSFHGTKKNHKAIREFEKSFDGKNINFEYEWVNGSSVKTFNQRVNQEKRSDIVEINKGVEYITPLSQTITVENIRTKADKILTIQFARLSAKNLDVSKIVDEILKINESKKISRIHVVGHTDSDLIKGRSKKKFINNKILSQVRALLVAKKLLRYNLGIDISYEGKGFSEPVAENNSAANKKLNRRSEIKLYFDNESDKESNATSADGSKGLLGGQESIKSLVLLKLDEVEKSSFQIDKILGGATTTGSTKVTAQEINLKPDNVIVLRFATLSARKLNIDDIVRQILSIHSTTGIVRIHVVGHTDSDPIRGRAKKKFKNNIELSKSRALAVAAKLLSHKLGIPISYDGKGFSEPVAPNDSSANKQLNRRSEIKLYFKKKTNNLLGEFKCNSTITSEKGVAVDGSIKLENQDQQRCMDVALEGASLQVRHNPLSKTKRLSVKQLKDGGFSFYTNYFSYIKKAELVINEEGYQSKKSERVFTVENLKSDQFIDLSDFDDGKVTYKLRVYDQYGNYDETQSQSLLVSKMIKPVNIWGESAIDTSGISIKAGGIQVAGEGIAKGYRVFVMGEEVPVGSNGKFILEQHFEDGVEYGYEVLIVNDKGDGVEYRRDIYIPKQDWFAVGLVDLTLGQNYVNGAAVEITQDSHHYDEKLYLDGRIAGYVKGKIRGKYLVTASIDTRESEINKMFSNFFSKDPTSIFRRIDPEEYYPVYGDDSEFSEDAPTQGKVYVKVKKDENYFLWGNFKTRLTETEFSQYDRSFYGAKLHLESKRQVDNQKSTTLDVFAASPETLVERDEFRATGSSFYWLRRRDIVRGSERVRVEVRDINSDIILSSRTLIAEQDYSLNYINGQVQLSNPLETYADQSTLVRSGSGSGNSVFLIVNYEYIPSFQDLDALAIGGRFSKWLGSKLKVGISAVDQEQLGTEFKQYGVDATYKIGSAGHLKLEWAQTTGRGNEEQSTIDGGFGFTDRQPITAVKANAFFAELALDLYKTEMGLGRLSTYFRKRDAGFAASSQQTRFETDQYGIETTLPVGNRFKLLAKYDYANEESFVEKKTLDTRLDYFISSSWQLALGYKNEDRDILSVGTGVLSAAIGKREDATAQLSHKLSETFAWYVFGQKTLNTSATRRENDRYGVGVDIKFKDHYTLGLELSEGDGGIGAQAKAGYKLDEQSDAYLSYLFENNQGDTLLVPLVGSTGNFVSGVKHRYNESSTIYYENKFDHGRGKPEGLIHSFGVELTPVDKWSVSLDLETGSLRNREQSTEIKRRSVSAGIAKSSDKEKIALNVEFRKDKQTTFTRETLLVKARYDRQLNVAWKLLTRATFSQSKSSQGEFFDGDYTEGAIAFAYRPVMNDKLNMLFRYGYTEVLPSVGQVTIDGQIPDFRQKTSQLSIDVVYDLHKHMSVGFKYGFALRSLQNSRLDGDWFNSNAHIAVLRFDFHVIDKWDLLVEGRRLWFEGNEQARSGMMLGVFRYMDKENRLRLGVGYNFSDFSDDLTNLNYDYDGWFINMTGSF